MRALRLLVVLALAGAALYDVSRAPADQVSARTVITGIHVYQSMVSPLLTSAGLRCRFEPSCSRYAEAVIARDGIVAGSWKALARVVRCGPWTAPGTKDLP